MVSKNDKQVNGPAGREKPHDFNLRIVRIIEINRTLRVFFVSAAVLFGIYLITSTIKEVLDKPAIEVLLWTLAVALVGPVGVFGLRTRLKSKSNRKRIDNVMKGKPAQSVPLPTSQAENKPVEVRKESLK